ncbi:MAG: hypothetical protein EBY46_02570 [Rhodobacteraceae bacterium]|nr:hypothetical protein [Paracoccaceae bacterium]
MRKRISEVGDTDNSFLPLWMRTQQSVGSEAEEYRFVLPLAYCKPGTSQFVKENITFEGIYSPMIEFVTEHYVINGSKENIRVNGEPFDKHERIGVKIASVKKRPNQVAFGRLIKS